LKTWVKAPLTFELMKKLENLRKKQTETEGKDRKPGMPKCLGTLEDLAKYQDKCAEIEKDIEKFKN